MSCVIMTIPTPRRRISSIVREELVGHALVLAVGRLVDDEGPRGSQTSMVATPSRRFMPAESAKGCSVPVGREVESLEAFVHQALDLPPRPPRPWPGGNRLSRRGGVSVRNWCSGFWNTRPDLGGEGTRPSICARSSRRGRDRPSSASGGLRGASRACSCRPRCGQRWRASPLCEGGNRRRAGRRDPFGYSKPSPLRLDEQLPILAPVAGAGARSPRGPEAGGPPAAEVGQGLSRRDRDRLGREGQADLDGLGQPDSEIAQRASSDPQHFLDGAVGHYLAPRSGPPAGPRSRGGNRRAPS